jgi:tetratricopeptide (TPR) repeat protein
MRLLLISQEFRMPAIHDFRKETMTEQGSVCDFLSQAYTRLRDADLAGASSCLDSALTVDFDNTEVLFAMACAAWWKEKLVRIAGCTSPFERGEYALSQWKGFLVFQNRSAEAFEAARYAFKQFVFVSALREFQSLSAEESEAWEPELSLRIGRCLKGAGDYDGAVGKLENAARERKDAPDVLAELADVYALINEARSSKALFREAFFLNPQRIDVAFLECPAVVRLVEHLKSMGLRSPELEEWIPVYGNLMGVFTVKRELKPVEVGKLRQSIYELENEVKENAERRSLLTPRLINRYFWLIDHYINAREDRARIDEVLLKIKLIDPAVHKQYVA